MNTQPWLQISGTEHEFHGSTGINHEVGNVSGGLKKNPKGMRKLLSHAQFPSNQPVPNGRYTQRTSHAGGRIGSLAVTRFGLRMQHKT